MEHENNRARNAFEFAYRSYVMAKSMNSFEPVSFVLGFSIYYEMKHFCNEVYGSSAWAVQGVEETLFGIPIRVTENNRYEVSLELSEFTHDFEEETLFGIPIRVTENNRYEVSLVLSEFTHDFEKDF